MTWEKYDLKFDGGGCCVVKAARKQCSSRPRTPRRTMRTGTWNVRTMDQARKAKLTARGMIRCKLVVLGMSETI